MTDASVIPAEAGSPPPLTVEEALLLLDWKRRVGDLYHEARSGSDPERAWRAWRRGRDRLFASHPRSPLASGVLDRFTGLPYFDYDPSARVRAAVRAADPVSFESVDSTGRRTVLTRVGAGSFDYGGEALELELYWLGGFRGGLLLPFRDATNGAETYGGGRYLLDTLKGEDLGGDTATLIFDFNYATHPPCFYKPEWSCPLAPPANHLPIAVRAGERTNRPE